MNTEIPAHKIGDTLSWAGTFELVDSAGAPISTAGVVARSQIRTPAGVLVAELSVTLSADTITLRSVGSTQAWPPGPAQIDVQFTLPDGQVVSTSTATLRLVRDVTQEEPAP